MKKSSTRKGESSAEVAVLELVGDLDRGAISAVADLCGEAAQGNVRCIVLDLSRVEHLDYGGIPALVARRKKLRAQGLDLVLVSKSRYLQQILRVGGGADIECVRTLQEAIDSVVVGQVDVATATAAPARSRKTG